MDYCYYLRISQYVCMYDNLLSGLAVTFQRSEKERETQS